MGNAILNGRYNFLKKRTLEIFLAQGSLRPRHWARMAKFDPVRASYTYLKRLHRFGLLIRSRDDSGRLLYSLSQRGQERLKSLSIPNGPNPSQTSSEETTRAT
jgi:hypothetical protein